MSGGHWGYIHHRLNDIADELESGPLDLWTLVGQRVRLVAEALNRIDRVICGDDSKDMPVVVDALKAAIGPIRADKDLAEWLRREAENFQVLADLIEGGG